MKNLLTVLKKLGKKMTSQDINGTNLVTVVDDIANKYTGGGGSGDDGGCDCTVVVGETVDGLLRTLDKTWQEIHDALAAGKHVIINRIDNTTDITRYEIDSVFLDDGEGDYVVSGSTGIDEIALFSCATPSDYPIWNSSPSQPDVS